MSKLQRAKIRVREISNHRILRATFNYGVGSYIPQFVSFFLAPIYTIYISPESMGTLELYSTGQILLTLIIHLGVSGAISRYYFELGEGQKFKDFVFTIATFTTVVGLTVIALFFVFGPSILQAYLPQVEVHPYLELMIFTSFLQIAPTWQKRILQVREQSGFNAKLNVSSGITAIFFSILFVIGFHKGAVGILWANLVTATIFFAVALVNLRADLIGKFRLDYLKMALHYGLPLLPYHAGVWAQQFLNRWVLAGVAGVAVIGELSIAAKIVSPLNMVIGAFGLAYGPIYLSWRKEYSLEECTHKAREVTRGILVFGSIGVFSAALFGGLYCHYAIDAAYRGAFPAIGILAASIWAQLLYMAIGNEIFHMKKTTWISLLFISACVVNLSLVLWLGDRGVVWTALAQLAGALVTVILSAIVVARTFPITIEPVVAIVTILAAAGGYFLSLEISSERFLFDFLGAVIAWLILCAMVLFPFKVWNQGRALLQKLIRKGSKIQTEEV